MVVFAASAFVEASATTREMTEGAGWGKVGGQAGGRAGIRQMRTYCKKRERGAVGSEKRGGGIWLRVKILMRVVRQVYLRPFPSQRHEPRQEADWVRKENKCSFFMKTNSLDWEFKLGRS